MRKLLLSAGIAAGVALAILGVTLFSQDVQTALADDPDGVITGIDMNPAGNTATSLGTIDRCRAVSPGDVIDIDVFIDDIEAGPPNGDESILGSGYDLGGWPASGTDGTAPQISACNHLLLLNQAPGSSIVDLSEACPDGDDPHVLAIADFGTAEYVSAGYTQGVIGRYTLDTTGAVAALYKLTLTNVVHGRDTPPGGTLTNQAIWDSNYCDPLLGCYGLLAVVDIPLQTVDDIPCVEVDEFPNSKAVVTVNTPLGPDTVTLTGPTTVQVYFATLGDADGDGRQEVQTEIVQMELTGTSTLLGPVTVRLRDPTGDPNISPPATGSRGEIEEAVNTLTGRLDVPPFDPSAGPADSFFDVYFEIELTAPPPFLPPELTLLHNHAPKHMETTITHKPPAGGETYEAPTVIPLFTEAEDPSGVELAATHHTPNPPPPPTPTVTVTVTPTPTPPATPPPGIGGVVDLQGGAADLSTRQSGTGAPYYIALAGVAAGAIALAAGGWYARRRWMR